jgi:predicted transcriptional regulator
VLKRTTVWLDTAELKELVKLGKKLDRPVSWLVRKALSELLERQKEKP